MNDTRRECPICRRAIRVEFVEHGTADGVMMPCRGSKKVVQEPPTRRVDELEARLAAVGQLAAETQDAYRDYYDVAEAKIAELEAELEKSELAYVKTLRQFCEERMAAEEKVKELEARLEEATGAFKNWHLTATTAWETNRTLEKQLADANARIAELEARLAGAETRLQRILPCVAEETYQRLMNNINQLEARAEKAEEEAGRLQSIVGDFMTDYLETHEECNCGGCTFCYAKAALRPAEAGEGRLRGDVQQLFVDIAQIFDGWHADGTAWTEWDESVRRRITQTLRPAEAGGFAEQLAAKQIDAPEGVQRAVSENFHELFEPIRPAEAGEDTQR